MASEWPVLSLREAGVQLLDCEHRTPPPAEAGYPYVAIPQVKDRRLDLSDVRLISREHLIEWTRKARPRQWDVILSRRCNPGETAVFPSGLQCALGQNLVLLRAAGKGVLPEFLRWLVRSPDWWEQAGTFINVGAVFDSLKCADIPNFRLPIPPLPEQRAIAHILGTLDDKIELNRRMNETLEAMARALFQSWFVDFDPVRAKAEGREPGLPADLAEVFPSRLVATDQGAVPEGWTRSGIGTWVDALSGGTPSRNDTTLWGGDIPWISPKVVTSIHADHADEYVTPRAIGNGTRLVASGATFVMVRGMGLHEKVRISQARGDVTFNQDVKALVPRRIQPSLLLFALLDAQDELLERVESSGHGTGRLPTDILLGRPIAMPPDPVQSKLTKPFDSINSRICWARDQSRTLAALRDTLLPKLISGELRVRDAQRFVG